MIPNPHPGIFIVFDGIDGCGKTHQFNITHAWMQTLDALGHCSVLKMKEPSKERFFGKKIYADLADKSTSALHKKDPHGFQAWYACDSEENLRQNIVPALKNGSVVLCDRFRSSMVYGARMPGEIQSFMAMNREIIGENFIWPDVIFVFDVSVETAIARLHQKNRELDQHEREPVLRRVKLNFLAFASIYPNCHVINAERTPEEIFENVKKIITAVLESKNKS